MKQHLAILTFDFFPATGGVQKLLYEVAIRMTESFNITILTPEKGPLPSNSKIDKIILPNSSVAKFWQAIRELKPDRLLVGHSHPRLFCSAWPFGNFGVIAYGNDYLAAQKRWHRSLFNAILRRACPLITISNANASKLNELGISPSNIIYPGTNPSRFFPPDNPVSKRILLTLGRIVPRKGHDMVLRALPDVITHFSDVEYHIAGTGPDEKRLFSLADELGIAQYVRFHGYVSEKDLPALYQSAIIFVMPVREDKLAGSMEGFGIVYLEASASGLPVIAGESGGAREAVKEGETGFLVKPDNPKQLAEAIIRLLSDSDLRRRMGKAGRRWVETEMNWDRAAHQIVEALK